MAAVLVDSHKQAAVDKHIQVAVRYNLAGAVDKCSPAVEVDSMPVALDRHSSLVDYLI